MTPSCRYKSWSAKIMTRLNSNARNLSKSCGLVTIINTTSCPVSLSRKYVPFLITVVSGVMKKFLASSNMTRFGDITNVLTVLSLTSNSGTCCILAGRRRYECWRIRRTRHITHLRALHRPRSGSFLLHMIDIRCELGFSWDLSRSPVRHILNISYLMHYPVHVQSCHQRFLKPPLEM